MQVSIYFVKDCRFKRRQHIENITDDDECPIHLFNYPWSKVHEYIGSFTT